MKPMHAMMLMAGESKLDSGRLWRSAAFAARCASLGLGLAVGFPLAAQEPDATPQTNEVMAAEVPAQIGEMVQPADSPQPEEMPAPEDVAATDEVPQANGLPQANGPAPGSNPAGRVNRFDNPSRSQNSKGFQDPSRSQNDDRRSRGRRSFRSRSGQAGGAGYANDYSRGGDRTQSNASPGTNGSLARLDYSAFRLIVDRNIFDPNRVPHLPGRGPMRQPRNFDSLTLVGIMSYEKGTFAFFDGTSSEYQKALKLTDAIAGFKVTNIAPNGVKLASGTNELALSVGEQLRREEDGPWRPAGQFSSYAATSSSASTNAAATSSAAPAPGGANSDILKRLMEKRLKE